MSSLIIFKELVSILVLIIKEINVSFSFDIALSQLSRGFIFQLSVATRFYIVF